MQSNAMFIIQPYKALGTWVFDDENRHLLREPFVLGVPEMIDQQLSKKGIASDRFNLVFTAGILPDADAVLVKENDLSEGAWYNLKNTTHHGWLCPALMKYFDDAPETISILINPLNN